MKVIKNKYYFWYYRIIDNARARNSLDKTECHHIVPRSLGGKDTKDNLVNLTLKEHWICHRLLVKFLADPKDRLKMYNALWMMLMKDYRTVTAREYKFVKESVVPWNKGMKGKYPYPNKTPDHVKQYFRELYTGKPRSEEDKQKMREGWKRAKANGYRPWNYGKKGIKRTVPAVTLISPDGKEITYRTLREGCEENNLIYSMMSSVRTGKAKIHRGWRVK